MSKAKFLFIDRDGTLIDEPPSKQVDSLDDLSLEPGVISALLRLKNLGYRFVMVTNQDGLGSAGYSQDSFDRVQGKLMSLLVSQGITFEAVLICPHWETDQCECRKPRLGLVLDYISMSELDRDRSYVIGDRDTDRLLAERMRLKSFLYDKSLQDWSTIVAKIENKFREITVYRKTSETCVEVTVNLDKSWPIEINTGLGFFNHMLEQFVRHAGISLQLQACGDLQVDEHHLIEDTALVLGQALREALGDKRGIGRYGFVLPMDEAKSEVALDLSGRPYFIFEGKFSQEHVGDLSTDMVPHFFRSLAFELKATLHLKMIGTNTHHQVESLFKCFGRALQQAKKIDGCEVPSTKGVL